MTTAEKLTTIAENQQRVYEAGQISEYNRFWDAFQKCGDPDTDYRFKFWYWEEGAYNPKYKVYSNRASMASVFQNSRISNTLVDVDFSATTKTDDAFQHSLVVTIPKLIVSEQNTFVRTFFNAGRLQNITVEGVIANDIDFGTCPLSHDSIVSVLGALSATATGKTATFKQTAVDAAFSTEEWDALAATKSNWRIDLV